MIGLLIGAALVLFVLCPIQYFIGRGAALVVALLILAASIGGAIMTGGAA